MAGASAFSSTDQTTPAQVAAAVMAVLREMSGAASLASPADQRRSERPASPGLTDQSSDPSVYQFHGTLLLERHAYEIPFGIREISIFPKTVVTPLAREILRKKGVSLQWAGSVGMAGRSSRAAAQWSILRLSDTTQAASIESLMAGRAGEGWELGGRSLKNMLEWIQESDGRHVGVLTNVGCVTVWRLQQAGVRSAEVRSSQDVEHIVHHFAPRALVVEPARMPIHEVKQIFQVWRRMGLVNASPDLLNARGQEEASQ
ncbi:MAG: hypothetical protein RJA81_1448 [Planctomycetota bacterium]